MKKRTLFILLVVLTLVFASFCSTTAFAEGEETPETTAEGDVDFTQQDLIKLIVTYCAFGLSIIVGIPAIRAVNKRKKQGYVEDVVRETAAIPDKLAALSQFANKSNAKRANLRYSIKIAAVADMALSTYTEKQESGFYDIFTELNEIKTRLTDIDAGKDEKDVGQEFSELIAKASDIAKQAKILADNQNKIISYNK